MTRKIQDLSDEQLDAALATLRPQIPSDTLTARIRQMAPSAPSAAGVSWGARRMRTIAAAAAVAAVAIVFALQQSPEQSPDAPVVSVSDPAGEIPVTELAVYGERATGPAELISLAGLPLE